LIKSLIIAAALTAAVSPAAVPDALRPIVGQWRLSDVGGKIACTLTLTSEPSVAGYAMRVPLACRRGFPPLKDISAWNVDAQGAIVFADPTKKHLVVFAPQAGAPYEAKAPENKTWRLEPNRAVQQLSARERMTGAFRLSGPGGTVLCDLNLTANLFGNAGSVTPGQCSAPWSDKAITAWALQRGRLTLFDAARKPLLVLKVADASTFVAADPKAETLTLARK
jgi:hypothetical protein